MSHNSSALIGYTGFVGSNIDHKDRFTDRYNSSNIDDIVDKEFELVICAGVQAVKWWANQNEAVDFEQIEALKKRLSTIKTNRFILISTVDVYPTPSDTPNELTDINANTLEPYGRHRYELEQWVINNFPNSNIIRLSALHGKNLKKNVIYDLMNNNLIDHINGSSSFQWYDLNLLWDDILTTIDNNLSIVNLVTEPISTKEIVDQCCPDTHINYKPDNAVAYNIKTIHDEIFGGKSGYRYNANESLDRIENYITNTSKND